MNNQLVANVFIWTHLKYIFIVIESQKIFNCFNFEGWLKFQFFNLRISFFYFECGASSLANQSASGTVSTVVSTILIGGQIEMSFWSRNRWSLTFQELIWRLMSFFMLCWLPQCFSQCIALYSHCRKCFKNSKSCWEIGFILLLELVDATVSSILILLSCETLFWLLAFLSTTVLKTLNPASIIIYCFLETISFSVLSRQ